MLSQFQAVATLVVTDTDEAKAFYETQLGLTLLEGYGLTEASPVVTSSAGLPQTVSATSVDRQCGSAQQAVNFSAALIAAGVHDAMIGSGVEHMGHFPFSAGMKTQEDFGFAFTPALMAKHNIVGQGLGAEMIADEWEIPAVSSMSWLCARTSSPTRPQRRGASSARSCR